MFCSVIPSSCPLQKESRIRIDSRAHSQADHQRAQQAWYDTQQANTRRHSDGGATWKQKMAPNPDGHQKKATPSPSIRPYRPCSSRDGTIAAHLRTHTVRECAHVVICQIKECTIRHRHCRACDKSCAAGLQQCSQVAPVCSGVSSRHGVRISMGLPVLDFGIVLLHEWMDCEVC